nr:MAG TPA: hypothetical protein [Caudoviricetes sp.]
MILTDSEAFPIYNSIQLLFAQGDSSFSLYTARRMQ